MIQSYLGDGVYAGYQDGNVWLTVQGQSSFSLDPMGRPGICLEPQVLEALNKFVKGCEEAMQAHEEAQVKKRDIADETYDAP